MRSGRALGLFCSGRSCLLAVDLLAQLSFEVVDRAHLVLAHRNVRLLVLLVVRDLLVPVVVGLERASLQVREHAVDEVVLAQRHHLLVVNRRLADHRGAAPHFRPVLLHVQLRVEVMPNFI